MALVTSWANRGDPILTDKSVEQRTYRVGTPEDFIDYREIIDKATEQWVGFEESAASAQIDLNQQPSANQNETYSWAMNEDSRVIGSYSITRQYEKKVTTVVGSTPAPVIGSVNFSVNSTNNTTFPFSLTMTTSVAGAVIRYRVDSYSGGTRVTGTWQTSSGTSQTITVNTSNIAGGAVIGGVSMHKYVIVEAYAYRVLQTGTYEGPRSERQYGYRAPNVGTISWSSSTNTNVSSWPFSLTLVPSNTDATVYYARYYLKSNGQLEFDGETNSTQDSITISLNPPESSMGASYSGVSYHKLYGVSAYPFITLDGFRYSGPSEFRYFGQRRPTVGSISLNPAGTTNFQLYGSGNASFPQTITVSASGNVNRFFVEFNAQTASGNQSGSITYVNDVSINQNTGQGTFTLTNTTTVQIAVDGVFRNRKFSRVKVTPYFVLDSIYYSGTSITRYYQQHLS